MKAEKAKKFLQLLKKPISETELKEFYQLFYEEYISKEAHEEEVRQKLIDFYIDLHCDLNLPMQNIERLVDMFISKPKTK